MVYETIDNTLRLTNLAHEPAAYQFRREELLCAVCNFLDLTRQGRGNWYASLDYLPQQARAATVAGSSL